MQPLWSAMVSGHRGYLLAVWLVAAFFAGCGPQPGAPVSDDAGMGKQPESVDAHPGYRPTFDALAFQDPPRCNPCDDFPASPVIDDGGTAVSSDSVAKFSGRPTGSKSADGPCVLEPESGSLFPQNWLRPRFAFHAGAGQTAFEIRLHSEIERNDLVVYTSSSTWTMPRAMWGALSRNAVDVDIAFTVRAWNGTQVVEGTSGTFKIAPVSADGNVVYWTTLVPFVPGGTKFKGFAIGDEAVVDVMAPKDTNGACVGCHTSTPDGKFVAFSSSSDPMSGDSAHIELRSGTNPAQMPDFLSPSASELLARDEQELPTFSKSHWSAGDHLVVTTWMRKLVWTDLEATSSSENAGWGFVVRRGDSREATTPAFSHDGSFVIYTSASDASTSSQVNDGDIYRVSFAKSPDGTRGGDAVKVAGASMAGQNEYYPAVSADDQLIAFNRSPGGSNASSGAEVFVVSSKGGTATRLAANDPCPCLGKASPGVTNSWPKWSPAAEQVFGKENEPARTYYWLVFSSTRIDGKTPQLFAAPVVVSAGVVQTYPALYLWNQPANEGNHTPAWDVFEIPVVP